MTAVFLALGGPGIVCVYLPAWITHWSLPVDHWGWRVFAFLFVVVGVLPLAESMIRFVRRGSGTPSPTHPTKSLVESGLYRYTRNPMCLGVLAIIAGQAILFRGWPLCLYMGLVALVFHLFVVLYEEPHLRRKYGGSYDQFCRDVPRWFPFHRNSKLRTIPPHSLVD